MEHLNLLNRFLPPSSSHKVLVWLEQHQAILKITRARASKLGDYRPPFNGLPHRISVNSNLHPVEFQITLVHEMAHLLCWQKFGRRVKAHGAEWKNEFYDLLPEICILSEFPEEVSVALEEFFQPGTTYRAGNAKLKSVLHKFNPKSSGKLVAEVDDGDIFYFRRRKFLKVRKVRTRYECICLNNNRVYSFNAMAQVMPATAS